MKKIVFFFGSLAVLVSNAEADFLVSPGRDWLIGFERSKMTTAEELLDGIDYLRMQLRTTGCTQKAGFTTLPVKNHLWDRPNSKKYVGFAWMRIPTPVAENCQVEIEKLGTWFKMLGMETVTVTAPSKLPETHEVHIKVDRTNFHCGLDKPTFPYGYSIVVNGVNLNSDFEDKCEMHRKLIDEAEAQGTLLATQSTSSYEMVDFTNSGNTGDNRFRWKVLTSEPVRITLRGIVFEGANRKYKEIAHE